MLASHPPHCAATAHRRAALLDLPATVAAPGPPDAPRRGPDSSRAPEPTVLWGSRPRAARHFASARLRERRRSSPAQRRAALGHVRVRGRAPRALEAPGVGALWAGGVAPFHGLVLRALVLDRSLGCGGARPTRHTTCMALHDAWRLHRPSPSYFLYFAISAVPFGAPIILAPFGTGEPMLSFSTELLAGATARGFSLPPAIPGSKPCVACVHLCDLAATAILLVAMMLCLRMRAPSRLCSAARQSAGRSFADDDCRRRGAHAGAAAAAVRDWLA
jgi:hypothetical protein